MCTDVGIAQNVVVYPISVGKVINVGAFHSRPDLAGTKFPGPWVTRVTETDLIKAHEGWEPEVRAILDVSPILSSRDV